MASEVVLVNVIMASGGIFTGGATAFVMISKAAAKKFKDFEKTCDLKYTSKTAFGRVEVKIGRIENSIVNIEKTMTSMQKMLYEKLSKKK